MKTSKLHARAYDVQISDGVFNLYYRPRSPFEKLCMSHLVDAAPAFPTLMHPHVRWAMEAGIEALCVGDSTK